MKHSPLAVAARAVLTTSFFFASIGTKADIVTLSNTNGTTSFDVPTNVVAQVVHVYCENNQAQVKVTINGQVASYSSVQRDQFQVTTTSQGTNIYDNIHANRNLPI